MGLQVVKCETKVKTVIGNIDAIVTAICIRDNNVCYEISYFHAGQYTTAWVKRYEFKIDYSEKKQAGLVNYSEEMNDENHTITLLNERN